MLNAYECRPGVVMSGVLNNPIAGSIARSEIALQLRVSLLEALAPDHRCAICGAVRELEHLEIDHVDGRTWYGRDLHFLDRVRRQWREFDQGIPLRALCRHCNASDGARFRGRARYQLPRHA